MAASTQKRILVVRIGATEVLRYSVAVGSKKHPTPNGRFSVRHDHYDLLPQHLVDRVAKATAE